MDFGKVDSSTLTTIDFSLPPDTSDTTRILGKVRPTKKGPSIYVGCAKWGRKDWVGKVYPKGTKEKDFLSHYAQHFNCIELNATFYRLPTVQQVETWKGKVGKGFKFCPKFSDVITHRKRLKDAAGVTSAFLEGIAAFGDTLGPVFLQTPPNFAPKNLDTLAHYIEALPKDLDLFVELRHPAWFADAELFKQVFTLFEKHKVGAVITDAAGRRDCVHMRLTTPAAFIRFVGNSLHPTDYSRCDDWVNRLQAWTEQGLKRAYFFMHQHEELHSPELCRYVIAQMNDQLGTKIPVPKYVDEVTYS